MALLNHIIETSLYVDDLKAAEEFYSKLLDQAAHSKEEHRHVFYRVGNSMLLLFDAEETKKSGNLPAHGAEGAGHVAFAMEHSEIEFWKQRLSQLQIEIRQEFTWPSGGKSIYFVDPSGNLLELVTPDVWG